LKSGADPNESSNNGLTPLLAAIEDSNLPILEILIQGGADVNSVRIINGTTPLLRAAELGNITIVKPLVENGAKLDFQNLKSGKHSLIVACEKDHGLVVAYLIQQGADLELKDEQGRTSLHYAVLSRQPEIVQLLLKGGADVNTNCSFQRRSALWYASFIGENQITKILINAGSDVNALSINGISPLFAASQEGFAEVAKTLIGKGADLEQKDDTDGATALAVAVYRDQAAVMKLLIDAGADVNTQTKQGFTPLSLAAEKGNADLIKLLLKKGANVGIKNFVSGQDALWISSLFGHVDIMQLLIDHSADINTQDINGNLAWGQLMQSACRRKYCIVCSGRCQSDRSCRDTPSEGSRYGAIADWSHAHYSGRRWRKSAFSPTSPRLQCESRGEVEL